MNTIMKPDGVEIELDTPNMQSPTLEERVRSLEANQNKIIEAINSWSTMLKTIVSNSNQIYPQIDTDYEDNSIHIRAPKSIMHSTSILLVLPTETMNPSNQLTTKIDNAKLIIHAAGKEYTLSIVKEDYNGNIVNLDTGDIVSNRLCVFRFDPYTSNRVILCHSLSFDSLGVNKFSCNEAIFNTFPKVRFPNGEYEVVLTSKTNNELQDELNKKYQKAIVFGTVPPSEYIKTNYLEEGQIYIQIGD